MPSVFETWMEKNNVEALACWLPTYENVIDGQFVMSAFGNDLIVLNIWTTPEQAYNQSPFADLGLLAFIRGGLAKARAEESAYA